MLELPSGRDGTVGAPFSLVVGLIITVIVLALIALFLVDVALYTIYTVRQPRSLMLLYGRVHRRTRGLRSIPGKLYRPVRGVFVELLVGSPDHLELSDQQRCDADLREEYSGRDVTERYDI